MHIPKRTKFRKAQRGNRRGLSKGARELAFGEWGLQAIEPAWMTTQQIESMRSTLSRHFKKRGKLFLRVFADKPYSKKPAETRMGKGKGAVEGWVSVVKRDRILVEIEGVDSETAKKILHSASCKLPMRTRIIHRVMPIKSEDISIESKEV
jgi:large subunit ribosomal protein L16